MEIRREDLRNVCVNAGHGLWFVGDQTILIGGIREDVTLV